MSKQTGVACECSGCSGPQWYENGACQNCGSIDKVNYTWLAKADQGGVPQQAPSKELLLQAGATAQLADVWSNLVLLRGLSPHLSSAGQSVMKYSSAPWYVQRGIDMTIQCAVPTDSAFTDRLNRASSWTDQSFIVRAIATFEVFGEVEQWSSVRFPSKPGMREFHHARRMRNKIAHGDPLDSARLTGEASQLFGPQAVVNGSCNLDIALVLEPLWARLLLYAAVVENGMSLPLNPAVVVAVSDSSFLAQTFSGVLEVPRSGIGLNAGNIVSCTASA